MYTTPQAAKIIGIHESTLASWVAAGRASAKTIGRAYVFSQTEVNRLRDEYAARTANGNKYTPLTKREPMTIAGTTRNRTNSNGQVYKPQPRQTVNPRTQTITESGLGWWREQCRANEQALRAAISNRQ